MAQGKKRPAGAAAEPVKPEAADLATEIEKAAAAIAKAAAGARDLSRTGGVEPLTIRLSKDISAALRTATQALERARELAGRKRRAR